MERAANPEVFIKISVGLWVFCLFGTGANSGAQVAQLAEHVLGKDEVIGSIPILGSRRFFVGKKLNEIKPGDSNGKGTVSTDEAARERRYDRPRGPRQIDSHRRNRRGAEPQGSRAEDQLRGNYQGRHGAR